MQNSILVRNILHLTDARYFAAMGVDWISMELNDDPVSFTRWHAMRDWVEGISLAAEIKTEDESVIARAIIDAKPDGIITDNLELIHLTGGLQLFYLTEQLSNPVAQFAILILSYHPSQISLETIIHFPQNQIYLEADWSLENISQVLEKGYRGGFCFKGSLEDQIGIKDYSQMDELIGLIKN